jgi:hypothetical protein
VDLTAPGWSTRSYLAAFGVLLAGSDTASVILQRGIGGSTAYEAVTDAQLGIAHGADTTWLVRENKELPSCRRPPPYELGQPSGGRDCYAGVLSEGVGPNHSYGLHVELPTGETISGGVSVPGIPLILAPEEGDRWTVPFRVEPAGAPLLTIPADVSAGRGTARLEVHGALERVWLAGSELELRLCDTQLYAPPVRDPGDERFDVWFYGAGCALDGVALAWDSLDLRLVAVAYEQNYDRYVEVVLSSSEIAREAAGSGLKGAVGVFGAAAQRHRILRVVVEEPAG